VTYPLCGPAYLLTVKKRREKKKKNERGQKKDKRKEKKPRRRFPTHDFVRHFILKCDVTYPFCGTAYVPNVKKTEKKKIEQKKIKRKENKARRRFRAHGCPTNSS
jgi:hypothetical protein